MKVNLRRHGAASAVASALVVAHVPYACAQEASSVTVYGIVDGSVSITKTGAAGVGSVTGVSSGVGSASRWGLRGREDLGSGYAAIFVLEAGLDLDTGAAKSFSGNPSTATPTSPNGTAATGWNRRSSLGIQTPAGTVQLGRDYSPFFYAALEPDSLRYGMFGNLQAIVGLSGGSERFARLSNAVFYTSPDLSGVKVRAAYSLGSESAGGAGALPRRANVFSGFGLEYVSGGLVLTSSYQRLYLPTVAGTPAAFTGGTTLRQDAMAGARFTSGMFSATAGVWKVDAPARGVDMWLGGTWRNGPQAVIAQVQRLRQDNPTGEARRASILGLAYQYSLSKRTMLYVTHGRADNNATASFSLLSSDTAVTAGAPGADPRGTAVGIRHDF